MRDERDVPQHREEEGEEGEKSGSLYVCQAQAPSPGSTTERLLVKYVNGFLNWGQGGS